MSLRLRGGWLVAVVVVQTACEPTAPPRIDLDQYTESPEVRVEVKAPAAWLRSGDSQLVTVVVTNISTRVYEVVDGVCGRPFSVVDVRGERVGPGQDVCRGAITTRLLAPGESFTRSGVWRGETNRYAGDRQVMLPPGEYALVGEAYVVDIGSVGGRAEALTIVY